MTRRNVWLVVTSLGLGPTFGALAFLAAVYLTGGAGPDPAVANGFLYYSLATPKVHS